MPINVVRPLRPDATSEALEEVYVALAEKLAELTGVEDWEVVIRGDGKDPAATVHTSSLRSSAPNHVYIKRVLGTSDKRLYHHMFEVGRELQNNGLADHVMKASVDLLDKLGLSDFRINVEANLDIGGYAWLRKGFFPRVDSDHVASYRNRLRTIAGGSSDPGRMELWSKLDDRLDELPTPEAVRAFVLSDEFREYKPLFLLKSWEGNADPSDPEIRKVLLGKLSRAAAPVAAPAAAPNNPVDVAIRRQVLIERFKQSMVLDFDATLAAIDRDIRERLSGDGITEFTRARLNAQLAELQAVVQGRYSAYIAKATESLQGLTDDEVEDAAERLNALLASTGYTVAAPGAEQVWATVTARPLSVRGASGDLLLEPFMAQWGKADTGAIVSAVQQGYFEGQTNAEIIQRIRGTRALKYSDGLLEVSRRHAEAVVRTAVQHVANVARSEVWSNNDDIVEGYQWLATLDSRTTPICKSLDGQRFDIGKGPVPPAHVNCRSTTIPVLVDALAGLAEGATRASDGGYVNADLTYYEWLKTQDADFQDLALGPTRGQLFRKGGLSSDDFARLNLSKTFEPLDLDEMRALNPRAFKRAGL